jgi:D-alanyl-D-alanine carboxypeptidase
MWRGGAGYRRAVHALALSGAALLLATVAASDNAQARARKHRQVHHAAKAERYQPPYASIVVDANSGKVLESSNPDSPRHPASLSKIMTLYLLFERMEAGKITPATELSVSEHASVQAPSKLGLKPGDTIRVENAIRAIVTKSANDVAVVVAEALGGTESDFGKMMTRKAHALGMTHTTYVNASGLPDDQQVTTARDQATLGRAIQDRFPKYYAYFSTRSFSFRGHAMRNHNKLLGSVEGVDGIKTGYTNASGFNLITSVRRGGRHIVAAVFGGRTANWRDARMRELIDSNIKVAARERSAPKLDAVAAAETSSAPALVHTASAIPMPVAATAPTSPPAGSTEPIKPNAVKTFKVKMASMPALGYAAEGTNGHLMPPVHTAMITTVATTIKTDLPPPASKPSVLGTLPVTTVAAREKVSSVPLPAASKRGGWLIQVGAFDDEADAAKRLTDARAKAKDALDRADPFTEPVAKGAKTMYRARFAGLDKEQAEAACKSLRRGEIPCMTLRN